jgi:hypothetical protein
MLDALLHCCGLVRMVRRENGIRIYRTHRRQPALLNEAELRARMDALVDVVINICAALPDSSLFLYIRRLQLCRAPMAKRNLSRAATRTQAITPRPGCGHGLVLVKRREPAPCRRCGQGALTRTV